MSRTREPLGEVDARLLRALREQYPDGHFDDVNIAIDAPRSPDLLRALDFLSPLAIDRRRRSLSNRSREAVERWIENVEGSTVDGLYLRRDRIGWCSVERHVEVVTPTGPGRMTRAQALAAAAVDIARHAPDLAALVEFLDIAGVKRLSAALRGVASSRPSEIGGKPKPDVEIWRRGRL
jgi:hypothetical protein